MYSKMQDILSNIPDKVEDNKTTSLKFKNDLISYLSNKYKDKTCLEIGSHRGYTTRILSTLFKKVISVDIDTSMIEFSKKLNSDRTNIEYVRLDVYRDKWNFKNIDAVFIDCAHFYDAVMSDIKNSIELTERGKDMLLIFDDYGLNNKWRGVKEAVNDYLSFPNFNILKTIGEPKGWTYHKDCTLKDVEGVICSYKNWG